jgi:hypothetical protein
LILVFIIAIYSNTTKIIELRQEDIYHTDKNRDRYVKLRDMGLLTTEEYEHIINYYENVRMSNLSKKEFDENLENLEALKSDGVITEEQFNQKLSDLKKIYDK